MGVPFRMVLYAKDETSAKTAAAAAFARIKALNNIMSDYEYESELSALSRTSGSGQWVHVSEDLWRVLSSSQEISQKSRGAFDVTVGPAVALWRRARHEKKLPDPEKLKNVLSTVGYEKLKLHSPDHWAELVVPNMRLDLGGIAKGYAVDEAIKVLKQHGITSALVSGGGDMFASGAPAGKRAWEIELTSVDTNAAPQFVRLKNQALTTSGDIFQYIEIDGKRYSHIVDPRTGVGLVDHSLVNIIASNVTDADALSTAVSVLGPTEGLKLIEQFPGVSARIVRKPSDKPEFYQTKNFAQHLK